MVQIDNDSVDGLSSLTPKLIASEVLLRGWKVAQFYPGSGCFLITRSDGMQLTIFSSTPPSTSFVSHYIAQDKFASYEFFRNIGIRQPLTVIVQSMKEAIEIGAPLLNTMKLVVKPLDKAHGAGITTGIDTPLMLESALKRAFKLTKKVLIQQFIENAYDIRVTIIDGRVAAALLREPAKVTGDGISTVNELIRQENESEMRGKGYSKPLNVINVIAARLYMGDRIKYVPKANEHVVVVGTANLGAGGETRDITDDLPEWLSNYAISIANAVNMGVVGVDMLIKDIPSVTATELELHPFLVEINKCPALFMHEMPTRGEARPVIAQFVDYLEKYNG